MPEIGNSTGDKATSSTAVSASEELMLCHDLAQHVKGAQGVLVLSILRSQVEKI